MEQKEERKKEKHCKMRTFSLLFYYDYDRLFFIRRKREKEPPDMFINVHQGSRSRIYISIYPHKMS